MLGRDDYVDAARTAAAFFWDELRDSEERLLRTWKDGEGKLLGTLEDHAYVVEAFLALYEATFEERWFRGRASHGRLDDRALFGLRSAGGFFTTASDAEELIARRKDVDDHPIPSGSSSAAFGLLRLAALTGDHAYAEHAQSVFRLFGRVAERHPHAVGHLLRAIDFHLARVKEVALVGDGLDELAAVVRSELRPHSCWPEGRRARTLPS